ncbi:two-component system sensor histidine kinase PmrB [uncultured Cedecea sp.]|uniref:two-component system sensor histidine kinase PmrB n=1 Tax=uncultured Cedecea sp. TaxID=988762 RepID=UPI002615CAAB|nr:two-component system sensor histidine kinase PmrB [uncultured Cedecea sp.]
MNSMRWRLIIILAFISLFFQTASVWWLWHESREQIAFLVQKAVSGTVNNAQIENEIHEAIAALLIPSIVMIGCILFFSFWAITWITRPLEKLRTSLSHRSPNDLSPMPVSSSIGEVVAITTVLNQLLARLDNRLQQERQFTADAAHELRTPLAGLKLHLELMANNGVPQAPVLLQRTDQLMHTIEQLLMLARAGHALASGHYQTLNWTDDIIAPLQMEIDELAMQRQQRIVWPDKTTCNTQGDAILLRLMLRNLLENACRYGPEKSVIQLLLVEQEDGIVLTVCDQGPGIAEQYRQHLTKPFERLDRRYSGCGLGLSIVHRIVHLHHGYLTLDNSSENGGLLASCWLPHQRE